MHFKCVDFQHCKWMLALMAIMRKMAEDKCCALASDITLFTLGGKQVRVDFQASLLQNFIYRRRDLAMRQLLDFVIYEFSLQNWRLIFCMKGYLRRPGVNGTPVAGSHDPPAIRLLTVKSEATVGLVIM
ncbi:hypothetical protein DITRI_Ditri07aG0058500 [Diplodiscus trichospermus]